MQSYELDEPAFDNKAYTFGLTYYGSTLQLYAMHANDLGHVNRKPKYRTTKIVSFELTNNLDTYCQGVGAFRNL